MILRPLLSLFLFMFSLSVFAGELPHITSHSKRDGIEIFAGDTLVLEATIEGKDNKISWVSQEKVLCKEAKCTIPTQSWSLGYRNVVLVVQNKFGTRSLTYKVRVKRRPEGSSPETVTPEMETNASTENLAHDEFFIRARLGLGFAHNKENEARIVNAQPSPLAWDTRFKSSGGVLQFGKVGEEDHVLMPGSFAYLDTFDGRRMIVLEDGMLRSRQIKADVPEWTIVSGDWLQVDGSKEADVIVNVGKHSADAKTPIARVVVLRGQARVLVRKPGAKTVVPKTELQKIADDETGESTPSTMSDDDKDEAPTEKEKDAVANPVKETGEQEFIVPAGATFLVNFLDQGDMTLRLATPALVHRVLENSSPKYLDYQGWSDLNNKEGEAKSADRYRDVFILAADQRPKTVDEAVAQASKLYPSRDYVQMLEVLLPLAAKNKDRFDLNLMLGQAYRGLRFYEAAAYYFRQAQVARPKDPEVLFQMGMLAVEFQRWEEAQNYLAQAEEAGHSQKQMILYYRGYTAMRRGRDLKAREYLSKSLWEEQNKELSVATRDALRQWDRDRVWVAKGRLATLYDTNVFRKPNKDPAPKNIAQSSGSALTFDFEVAARAFQSDAGNFTFGFDFSYLSWFKEKLKAVDTGYQKLYSAFNYIGGEPADPWLLLDAQIYLASTIVGGQRATDGLGLLAGVIFPQVVLEPEVFFDTSYHVDPMPNRNDGIDPFLWEVVGASDRSARVRKIGLGATIAQDESSQWRARYTNTANIHSARVVSIDDFSENRIDVIYDLQSLNRLEYGAQFHVGTRAFSKAPDNRKDSFFGAKGLARWYQTPFLSYDGWLTTQFQSSNRASNKYAKFILGAGAQMEL